MGKKAELGDFSQLIVAVVVGLLLVILYFVIFAPPLYSGSDREDCRISVLAASKTKPLGLESPIVKDLACKTQFLEISDKLIKKSDKVVGGLPSNSGQATYKIKRAVSDEMYDCWYQMGEGKVDPWASWGSDKKRCIVCSHITFTDTAKSKYGTIGNFGDFLCAEKIPGKDMTYCTYFFGANQLDERNKGATIETQDDHIILYSFNNRGNLARLAGGGALCGLGIVLTVGSFGLAIPVGVGACAVGAAGAVAFPDGEKDQKQGYLALMKAKDLKDGECDQLY